MAMKAVYHDDGDILYVYFSSKKVHRTRCLDDWRNLDLAEDGTPVGVEFIGASGGVNLTDVPRAGEIAAIVAAKKFDIPILKPEVA
jgi:uncharacterized protein YuzE